MKQPNHTDITELILEYNSSRIVFAEEEEEEARLVVSLKDITENRQAEERIREQAALLDKARDAICVNDLNGHITFWNKSAELLYGWTAEEALGKNAFMLLSPQETLADLNAQRTVLETGEWSGEFHHVTKQGEGRMVDSRLTLIRNHEGRPNVILSINSDITEKKRIAAQLLRAERMDSLGMLAGGVAHDLNNALAPILMGAEMLRLYITAPTEQRMINNITIGAQHGAALVQQLLTFARGEDGARTEIEITRLIADVRKLLRSNLPSALELSTHVTENPWSVVADATQLKQVLLNLSLNARDAMPHGGRIIISAENVSVDDKLARLHPGTQAGPHLRLAVRDTGTGIPPALLNKIFDPFFTTKSAGKGTGLGLSMVMGIVKSHGGFLNVESAVGQGTIFELFFPARTSAPPCVQRSVDPFEAKGRGERILLIEDDPVVRDIFQLVLEAAQYRVVATADGHTGLAEFERQPGAFAVVLTDMMMPGMNGPEVIAAVRRRHPRQAIIGISGFAESGGAASLRALDPPVECLGKPISAETLLVTLRRLLAGQEGKTSPAGTSVKPASS